MTLASGLGGILAGDVDLAARMFRCVAGVLDPMLDSLAAAVPVGDPSPAALRRLTRSAVAAGPGVLTVPLSDVEGRTTVVLSLGWSVLPEEVPGIPNVEIQPLGADLVAGRADHVTRGPDASGRLPREQFIGSADLRLSRLFAARGDLIGAVDRPPADDCESAFLLQYADGDIYNGGLHQLFSNSTGNFAPWLPPFARRIGAARKSDVVRRANAVFEGVDLADRWARNARLDALTPEADARLDDLTGEYYDVESEDITELLAAHVERNPDDFLW